VFPTKAVADLNVSVGRCNPQGRCQVVFEVVRQAQSKVEPITTRGISASWSCGAIGRPTQSVCASSGRTRDDDCVVWLLAAADCRTRWLYRYRAPPPNARVHLTPRFTTSTTTTVEAIEPRTIVEIAIIFGVELYRPIYIYLSIDILLED
jgi:hypothetical protein